MAAIMNIDEPRPRGSIMGERVGGPPLDEGEHFFKCPLCHGYIDMRDRAWVEDHEGELPHPSCDGVQ
jgi:hypothetical protein